MKIDNNAWFTLYNAEYDSNQYYYHYTNIDNAVKILNNNSLKFSKICNTNDTLESKPKLGLNKSMQLKDVNEIRNFFSNLNSSCLQILCLTKDYENTHLGLPINDTQKFGDFSGRGFSSPRMWAQYSNNNCGVCFVFKKNKLNSMIKGNLSSALIHSGDIDYISRFDAYPIDDKTANELLKKLNSQAGSVWNSIFTYDLLKNNEELVKYCYFSKLDDWAGENEYRFLAFGDSDYYINGINDALSGVIVGEKISPENLEIMSYFCYDICELKKVIFSCTGCNLINIYND